jgi:hypothetical protein
MDTPANAPDPARTAPRRDGLLVEPFDVRAIADAVAMHRGTTLKRAVRLAPDDEAALLGMAAVGPAVWEDAQRIAKRLRFDERSPAWRFVTEDAPSSP